MRWPFVCMLCLSACHRDADLDGFSGEDCDDEDPFIYPGAPDSPGDGIDADCDGTDPGYRWLGDWQLATIDASYFSIAALDPQSASGTMTISDDFAASLDLSVTLAAELIGFSLDAVFALDGTASVIPLPDQFDMTLDGTLFDEQVNTAIRCTSLEEAIDCEGGLKALDINLDLTAAFVRP